MEWYCFKCKEKMVEAEVEIEYLSFPGTAMGIKCPKCGAAYLLEQRVVEEVRQKEDEIEAKL